MARPFVIIMAAVPLVVVTSGCSTLLGLAVAPQATVAAAAAATTGAVAGAVVGQPSQASRDIDRILRENPDIDQAGTLRDLQSRLPPERNQPDTGYQDRAAAVSRDRDAEHDRHAEPGTHLVSDIFTLQHGPGSGPRGLRHIARSHPDADDLPRWKHVSYTMDLESVRFDQ